MNNQIGLNTLTYLYQLYDATGARLYVGVTTNVQRRLQEHRVAKSWFGQVAEVEVEPFPCRWRAVLAEASAGRGRYGLLPGGIGKKLAAAMTDEELREAAAHPVYSRWSDGILAKQWGISTRRVRDLRASMPPDECRTEAGFARQAGVDRQAVRKWLGKKA